MHLCVELSDVGSDFLLGFCLRLTGEGFSLLLSLLVKVPDYALPAAIGSPKYIAICCESFLWHGATPFLNHQQYSSGGGNVQTNVVNGAEKNLPTFWWIYTCLGRGNFFRPILCLATQFLRWPWLSRGGEKRGGTGGSPPHKVHGGQPGALLALPKGRYFLLLHYRCWPLYVQLFIFNFLCICLLLFGTSFYSCPGFISVLPVALYRSGTNLHRGLTPGQQGWSAASVVSFPYPASKTAQRATQGRVWLSLSFPGALLLR